MIPAKVNIGGHEYNIREPRAHELQAEGFEGAFICYVDNDIALRSDISDSSAEQLLSHEIIHAFVRESGLEKILDDNDIDHEVLPTQLENILWQFLKNNTNFFEEKKKFPLYGENNNE